MRGASMDIHGDRTLPPRRLAHQQQRYGRIEENEPRHAASPSQAGKNMKRLFRKPLGHAHNTPSPRMMPSTPSIGLMSTYSTNTKLSEWICSSCSYVNADGGSKVCSICGCRRNSNNASSHGHSVGTRTMGLSSQPTAPKAAPAFRGRPSPTSSPADLRKQKPRPPEVTQAKPMPEILYSSASSSSSTKERRRVLRNEFLNGEDSDSSKEEILDVARSRAAPGLSVEPHAGPAQGSQTLDESSDSVGFVVRARLRPGMLPRSVPTGGKRMPSFNEEDGDSEDPAPQLPRWAVTASSSLSSDSSFIRPVLTRKDSPIKGARKDPVTLVPPATLPQTRSTDSPGAATGARPAQTRPTAARAAAPRILPPDGPTELLPQAGPIDVPAAATPQTGSPPFATRPAGNRVEQNEQKEADPADRIVAMMRSLEAGEGLPPQPDWSPPNQGAPRGGRSTPASATATQNRRDRYVANSTQGEGGAKRGTEMSFARWTDDDNQAWECKVCTFVNENVLHLTCQICGNRRGGANRSSSSQSEVDNTNNESFGSSCHGDESNSAGTTGNINNNNEWSPALDEEEEALQRIRRERIDELVRMQRELLEDCQKKNNSSNLNDSSSSIATEGSSSSRGRNSRLRRLNQVSSNLTQLLNLHKQEEERRNSVQGEQQRRRSIIEEEEGPNAFNAMEASPPTDSEARNRRQNFAATPSQMSTRALEWLGTQRRLDDWDRELEDRRFRLDQLREEQERLWALYSKKLEQ